MLLTRVITAAVLLLILVVAAQAGDHVLNAVLAVGYGITLAEWLKLTKLSGTPSYLLGGCFALVGAGLALGAADLDVFGSVYLALQLAVACIWLAVTAVCYNASRRNGPCLCGDDLNVACRVAIPAFGQLAASYQRLYDRVVG